MIKKSALICLLLLLMSALTTLADDPTPTQEVVEIYWEGTGDTPPMSFYAQEGGSFLRFSEFPVRVYLNPGAGEEWKSGLDGALRELNAVVPMIRTARPAQADILLEILPEERFKLITPCDVGHQEACSLMRPIGEPNSGSFDLISRVWIREDSALPPQHLLLHELIHALGLLVHSPNPQDVMYNRADAAATNLSLNDRATLLFLYAQPALQK